MHRLIRWFLYSILTLVAAIWLALGLIKPEYLRGPLVTWIQQETGLPLEIGKLNYNPIYPNIILAENVTLGPDIRVDKIYIEIAEGSWWQRKVRLAHLDIVHPQIKWQPGLSFPQPFRQVDIDDLTIDKLSLTKGDMKIDEGALHLKKWQPILAGELQPDANVTFTAGLSKLSTPQFSLGHTQVAGEFNDGQLILNDARSELLGGAVAGTLNWDIHHHRLQFKELELANLHLDLANLPPLPDQLPTVSADSVSLENINAINLNTHFALNNASGSLQNLQWQSGQEPTFEYRGKLGEFTLGLFQLTDMEGEGQFQSDAWQLKMKGSAYSGHFATEVESDRKNQTLTIDELQLNDMQTELYPGWRERLAALPYQQIDVRRADLNTMTMISFDDSVPLTIKRANLFLTDLRWTPAGLQTSNHKARMEADWLELVWQTLVSRKADIEAELADNQITIEKFTAQLEDSPLTIAGHWALTDDGQHQLSLSLKQFDLEQLSDMLGPRYPFAGKATLDLQLQSSGHDWTGLKNHLNGVANLLVQDLYVDGLHLDPYLDVLLTPEAPASQTFEQMIGKLRSGDTFFNHALVHISATDGQLNTEGSAFESITHLIGLKQGLDLTKNKWNMQLGLLNDQYQSELNGKLDGDWNAPQLAFSLPTKNEKRWETTPINYPPQGKNGALRE